MSYLIGLCVKQNADFAKVQDQAELLDPYAVEARYPGDAIMPPVDEADEALAAAKAIWDFVLTQLPPEDCLSSEKAE